MLNQEYKQYSWALTMYNIRGLSSEGLWICEFSYKRYRAGP